MKWSSLVIEIVKSDGLMLFQDPSKLPKPSDVFENEMTLWDEKYMRCKSFWTWIYILVYSWLRTDIFNDNLGVLIDLQGYDTN